MLFFKIQNTKNILTNIFICKLLKIVYLHNFLKCKLLKIPIYMISRKLLKMKITETIFSCVNYMKLCIPTFF